jgi:thiol-disulfide isomerase/thioredoxin
MMNRSVFPLLLGWLILSSFFCSPAFSFQLETLDGQRENLMDYVGGDRWTLVFLWATDCVPCEAQKPMIESFHSQYKDSKAAVVGVVIDGRQRLADIEMLMARHKPSYPNLVVYTDVFKAQFTELTGAALRVTPTYLLFEPDGTLAGVHVGPIDEQALVAAVSGQ